MNFASTVLPESLPLMDIPGSVEVPRRIENRIEDVTSTDNESEMREIALASSDNGVKEASIVAPTCPCVMCAPRVNFTVGELREAFKGKGKRQIMKEQDRSIKKPRVVQVKPAIVVKFKKDALKVKTVAKKPIAKGQQAKSPSAEKKKTILKSKKVTSAALKKSSSAKKKKPATPGSKKVAAVSKKNAAASRKTASGPKKIKIAAGVVKKGAGKANKKAVVATKKKATVAKSVKKAPARKAKAN